MPPVRILEDNMNSWFVYIISILRQIQTSISEISGGGGSNPTGGTINVATTNYEATLQQQFNTLDTGSSSVALMNLPNSIMEPMNLYLSSLFWANYTSVTNALNDNIMAFKTANGIYLPGMINPAHLRLSAHFEGTGLIPNSIVSTDTPIYNSTLGSSAALNLNSNQSAVSLFTGGTPTMVGGATGTVAEAFDANAATLVFKATSIWVKYQLASPQIINSFSVLVGLGGGGTTITSFVIEGSNNDTDYVSLSTSIPTNNVLSIINITNTVAYTYYRFTATSNSGNIIVKDLYGYYKCYYDTDIKKFGTSSLALPGNAYLSGAASAVSQLQLGSLDWHYRDFVRFSSSPNPMALFTIAGKQLEILATSSGLQVNYSTNGTSFTAANSSAISWSTDTWYFISVRRTGNTLYFYVDNVAYGTADLTGVTLFTTSTNAFYVGCDTALTNLFAGNMDELEFFVGESTTDAIPVAARSTAHIPAVSWQSTSTYIKSDVVLINCLVYLDEVQFSSFGVPIPETDLHFLVSIDNGSTWNDITLIKVSQLTTADSVYSGTFDATGLTNTNKLKYKITSAAGKVVKFDGLILYWA